MGNHDAKRSSLDQVVRYLPGNLGGQWIGLRVGLLDEISKACQEVCEVMAITQEQAEALCILGGDNERAKCLRLLRDTWFSLAQDCDIRAGGPEDVFRSCVAVLLLLADLRADRERQGA